VDNGKIESHFEQLPSETVERKTVNFATDTPTNNPAQRTVATPAKAPVKPLAKAAPRKPLTAAEQQQIQQKREQLNDAFHGRLAGIKHNVDALNHRLTDFEEKVHKEDAKLDKGNPDDFKVDLH
jgi:hypothetical protein